ncbi:putative Anti-sigma factor [Burkholderiales bacterium]|nr:putative Anti-sigma factor [Burkholderiales bacterium]
MKSQPIPEVAAVSTADPQSEAERLSAWLDGELEANAAEPLVQKLLNGRPLQRQYQSWCMVGDALRSQEVAAEHSPRLCVRISRALQDEPALLAPRALRPGMRRHLTSAVAVAAAMAVLVLVAVPLLRGNAPVAELTADNAAVRGAASGERNARDVGATEPSALARASAASDDAGAARHPRLDPYFQAHRDFTAAGVMPAAAVYLRSGNEGDR